MSEEKLNPKTVGKSLKNLLHGAKANYNDGKSKHVILKINDAETELQIQSKGLLTTTVLAKINFYEVQSFSSDNLKFTLVVHDKHYELEAGNKEEFQHVFPGISFLVRENNLSNDKEAMNLLILKRWMKADANLDGKLDVKEISVLCNMLNFHIDMKNLHKKFEAFDTDKSGTLEYEEFVDFFKDMMKKPELEELFNSFKSSYLYKDHMSKFLKETQGEDLNEEGVVSLMKELFASNTEKGPGFNLYDFTRYLFSKQNSAYNPIGKTVYQDMTKPLPYYYMKSSHNTYLCGNQLTGNASVEMYQKVLELGCRCLELDCWDGPNGDPIVTHGHTLVNKLKFEDVIKCINNYGFKTSPYPIVLSIELHAGEEQQIKMVKYMKDIFGDRLYYKDIKDHFPSPDELKYKVLVKNKKPKNIHTQEVDDDDQEDEDDESEGHTLEKKNSSSSFHTLDKKNSSSSILEKTKSNLSFKTEKKKPEKKKLSKELIDITVFDSIKLKGLTEKEEPHQMHSISETTISKLAKKEPKEMIDFSKRQFLRIYPKGTRITSTNLDPLESWAHGCQMIAFNYQTYDYGMRLNLFKFMENGSTGYILKPPSLLGNIEEKPLVVKITVISGEQIPRPGNTEKGDMVDPFVTISLLDKTSSEVHKTKVIYDEGFHPVWNEKFEFKVPHPDISAFYISIFDKNTVKDEFIGDSYVPITQLRKGYRNLEFYDSHFKLFEHTKVLFHFQIE